MVAKVAMIDETLGKQLAAEAPAAADAEAMAAAAKDV